MDHQELGVERTYEKLRNVYNLISDPNEITEPKEVDKKEDFDDTTSLIGE